MDGGKGTSVTYNGFWGLAGEGNRWGLEGAREKVSHVTVSRVWKEKGKGVTCSGFWGVSWLVGWLIDT